MLIRYPGSKDRHSSLILPKLDLRDRRICEPFAGTAAVAFACLRGGLVDQVWLNDSDRGISDLWSTVRDYPDRLCDLVSGYIPSAHSFYALRDQEFDRPDLNAFATIVLHQISYSGLGRKAGSPIGGREQQGKYKVGCRWNASRITASIREAHGLLAKARTVITNADWSDCPDWSWYVDPPYVDAGSSLYRDGVFPVKDLCDHLHAKGEWWVLSYDNAPEVQSAYHWAHIDSGGETYLGQSGRKTELLITPPARG